MIPITKEESKKIRERYRRAPIVRTVKSKHHRHRYFVAEEEKYLRLIPKNELAAKVLSQLKNSRDREVRFY